MINIKTFIQKLFHLRWDKEVDEFQIRTRQLVKEYDSLNESGQYKRNQIYARLIKEFPSKLKHEIGLEIELAVGELRN